MAEDKKDKQEKQERKRQFNKIQLSGHLGADPEYNREKGYFRFPLPVENGPDEKTGWIQVVTFGDKAQEAAGKKLKKGSYIQVTNGRLRVVPWEADGRKGVNVEIIAYELKYGEEKNS